MRCNLDGSEVTTLRSSGLHLLIGVFDLHFGFMHADKLAT